MEPGLENSPIRKAILDNGLTPENKYRVLGHGGYGVVIESKYKGTGFEYLIIKILILNSTGKLKLITNFNVPVQGYVLSPIGFGHP